MTLPAGQTKRVVIVGGGISGLATAYYVREQARSAGLDVSCTLLEAGGRLGGKFATEQVDGFLVEGGPDCFLTMKPWAAELCRKLGLGEELTGTNSVHRTVYVLKRGRLTPLPEGVLLVVPTRLGPFLTSSLISWPGKLRMGLDLVIPARRGDEDESVASFVRRRLGREALERIAEPLMGGIHTSDPERQSLLGTFPRFRDLELRHGSLIRGMLAERRLRKNRAPGPGSSNGQVTSVFTTLKTGMGRMVDALAAALDGVKLVTGVRVTDIERGNGGCYRLHTASGAVFEADALVLTTPANVTSTLVATLASDLSAALAGIRYVSTANVSLAFRREDVAHPLAGSGFVVPKGEGRAISGCSWSSTKFPHRAPANGVLVRCFIGGPSREAWAERDEAELAAVARRELAELMGIRATPVLTRVFRWPNAMPQYDVGHPDRVKKMRALCARQPGMLITGAAFEGVGVPDCVRQAHQAAAGVVSYLSQSRTFQAGGVR